jgi:hypothetical protein
MRWIGLFPALLGFGRNGLILVVFVVQAVLRPPQSLREYTYVTPRIC